MFKLQNEIFLKMLSQLCKFFLWQFLSSSLSIFASNSLNYSTNNIMDGCYDFHFSLDGRSGYLGRYLGAGSESDQRFMSLSFWMTMSARGSSGPVTRMKYL